MNDYTKNTLETLIPEVEVLNFIDANSSKSNINALVFETISELYKARIKNFCTVSVYLSPYKNLNYEDFLNIVKIFAKKNFKVLLYTRK